MIKLVVAEKIQITAETVRIRFGTVTESLGHASLEILLPMSEYDKYPIGAEFFLGPTNQDLLMKWILEEFKKPAELFKKGS